ncbi:MAG: N-6 DNA methylase [Candidatus Levybacteria bacterium]|nr:N-6 DNA methylase [Candidatus Levybacteria bacterium]
MNKLQKEAKEKIKELIGKYELAVVAGQIKKYTEEETKNSFIKPLFEALGWDFSEKNEVSAEENIISSGRVDYGFYINGRAKFYLEAKKLKADLNSEEFARQAIRYGFNKGVTWAVLTDFESIKVFNSQALSNYLGDKLYFEINYSEYLECLDQLWLLSKEAFETDLIDKEAEKAGKKLQKVPVTELLYKDLNECRKILTEYLGKWNPKVTKDLLDEGVQKLLDRLIFIRVAEDRKIEQNILVPLINQWRAFAGKNKPELYESMADKFRELDDIYNSNLFTPHPFEKWEDDGGALEKVIKILHGKSGYYEYDFSVMPADVLGSVYENYLGHKLSQSKKGLTLDKTANKRKEQGIYYTPTFIVDYIVRNALKPVLDKCRSINDLKKIKVLDPACGSGSFLIKALEVIAEKYKDFNAPINEFTKIQIILENLYGVDLDMQAVEIARLNLLVNTLEEKGKLPSLDKNIKNGNSLISGTDEELEKYFDKNFRDKKPFNWQEEFPEVFKQGGFDVIIGNPPYIFARGGNFDDNEKKYYYDNYKLQKYQINTYLLFIERTYNLLKQNGRLGFIVPNNWLTISTFKNLREFILKEMGGVRIINTVEAVFSQASVDTCILIFEKSKPTEIQLGELRENQAPLMKKYKPEDFYANDFIINITKISSLKGNAILNKIDSNSLSLSDIARVSSGLKAYQEGKGKPIQTKEIKESRKYHSQKRLDKTYFPYLQGSDVKRYFLDWSKEYLSYGDWLAEPRKSVPFNGHRILVRQIPSSLPYCINAAYTEDYYFNDINSMVIFDSIRGYDLRYILGIINTKLISYWFANVFDKFQRKIFPQFKVNELAKFPIYKAEKNKQKAIIELVNKIMQLKKDLKKLDANSNKWVKIKEEIEKTDKKIDEEVYKLYGLTQEEIRVVEDNNEN